MHRRLKNCIPARRGLAIVEFAVCLPLLAFLFVITVDFARVFYYSVAVTNCARDGAVYGSSDAKHAVDTAGIAAATRADAQNPAGTSYIDPAQLAVTSSVDSLTNPTLVTVTVTYPFNSISSFPGVPVQTLLRRTVQIPVAPAVPKFN